MKTKPWYVIVALAASLSVVACSDDDEKGTSTVTEKNESEVAQTSNLPSSLIAEPVTQLDAKENSEKHEVTLTGTIVYKDLEGGFFAFITQNGKHYTPHGLDETYRKNGLLVEIKGITKPDIMTTTQFGTVLQVTSVKVISSENVKDNSI